MACARICEDKKATEIVILDVRKLNFLTDYFVICSTQNERQSRAIAEEMHVRLKAEGRRRVGSEGERDGLWVLQDFGDVVIHIFRGDQREFYDLDALWADAPQMKWKAAAKAPRKNGAAKKVRSK